MMGILNKVLMFVARFVLKTTIFTTLLQSQENPSKSDLAVFVPYF